MRTFWGRIDLDRMPPQSLIRVFEQQAQARYKRNKDKITQTRERFCMEYVWNAIADWQEIDKMEDERAEYGRNV